MKPYVLLTNDDGIFAPGLYELSLAIKEIADVVIVAPDSERSAAGHAITIADPLRVFDFEKNGEFFGYAVNGTPADCVKIAYYAILDRKPDAVISGINLGSNTGINVIYSGTVSAATEGNVLGIPAFAVSLATYSNPNFKVAAQFARKLLPVVLEKKLPLGTCLNVNVPNVAEEKEIKGVKITRQGKSEYEDHYDKRTDPRNHVYYWLTGSKIDVEKEPEVDDVAITQNYISVTPLHYDLTNYNFLSDLRGWKLKSTLHGYYMSELHTDSILILDFGSQYTQLIARKIREIGVYGEIKPYFTSLEEIKKINPKGLVLSGGPNSVYADGAPHPDAGIFELEIPILGICYGLQLIVQHNGGKVKPAPRREYGRAVLEIVDDRDIFAQIPNGTQVWMSHGDSVTELPVGFSTFAKTGNAPHAAIAHAEKHLYGLQFHPEVAHTELGTQILRNFAINTCGCDGSWTPENFIQKCVQDIREKAGSEHVLCALSGGVDSAVAAALIYKALGEKLHSVFVDTGLMRLNEAKEVTDQFSNFFGSGFTAVDAETRFLNKLSGVDDPEKKRKIIGEEFIRVFEEEAKKLPEVRFLVQGTLYPDVIESVSPTGGPSVTIKSHHNVGGLPEKMHLDLIEPLRELFKDEVRQVGKALGLPDEVLGRHPFPGPGLAVRILGKITRARIEILQKADAIYIEELRKSGWYDKIWQAFAVLLPVHTVGVMGDQRTYENAVALRAVTSTDGMTADWGKLPYELLGMVSNRIINEVKGINRVVYDISSKPPATIEWE